MSWILTRKDGAQIEVDLYINESKLIDYIVYSGRTRQLVERIALEGGKGTGQRCKGGVEFVITRHASPEKEGDQ